MRSNGLTSSSSDATRPSPSKLGWRSLLPRLATALTVLLALCVTACSTSRKATEVSSSVLTTDYTNLTDKHDSVTVIIRDTLREVTTITIRENEQGDTLRVSTVTDRERLTTRDLARATEVKIVERIDTVYIQKDSIGIEDKKLGLSASADGGPKRSGLSELFLCHDSG